MSKFVEVNEKIAEKVVEGYKKIEDGVVGGYKKIEEGAVEGFNKVSDAFIEKLFTKERETVEAGKKSTELDERYFKLVESCLHSELAFALQMEKEDVKELIIKTIEEEE